MLSNARGRESQHLSGKYVVEYQGTSQRWPHSHNGPSTAPSLWDQRPLLFSFFSPFPPSFLFLSSLSSFYSDLICFPFLLFFHFADLLFFLPTHCSFFFSSSFIKKLLFESEMSPHKLLCFGNVITSCWLCSRRYQTFGTRGLDGRNRLLSMCKELCHSPTLMYSCYAFLALVKAVNPDKPLFP